MDAGDEEWMGLVMAIGAVCVAVGYAWWIAWRQRPPTISLNGAVVSSTP